MCEVELSIGAPASSAHKAQPDLANLSSLATHEEERLASGLLTDVSIDPRPYQLRIVGKALRMFRGT